MADFTALKTAIQTYIKQNGNEEITGNILQEILLSVVTTLGDGAINDLITALGNEVNARQQADGTLQQNITNEATARGNADTALSNRLGSTITAENTAAAQIAAEAEARANADNTLQGLINGIKQNIDNGYVYAGIATPSTTPVTGKVFYLALTAGTYTNFGSTAVTQGINILKYDGSAWVLDAFIGIDGTPTPDSQKLVKSGGVFDSVMTNGSAFDISAHFAAGGTLATYADLSAALTALNGLDAAYKRGGMSIRFVQSSDNKYEQYRCISEEFTIDTDYWVFCGNDTLVENPEYIAALLDAKRKLIIGAEKNGNVRFGAGVPSQITEYTEKKYGRYVENPIYTQALIDSNNRVLFGIKKDGDSIIGNVNITQLKKEVDNINLPNLTKAVSETIFDEGQNTQTQTILTTTEKVIASYINGIVLKKEINNPMTSCKKDGDKLNHNSSFEIINGVVYMLVLVNPTNAWENPDECGVRLCIFDLNSPNTKTYVDIAKVGDSFGSAVLNTVADGCVFKVDDNTLRICWSSIIGDEGYNTLCSRTYTISTSALSNIEKCTLTINQQMVNATRPDIETLLIQNNIPFDSGFIGENGYIMVSHASPRVEDNTTYYYTALTTQQGFQLVVKTLDFKNWVYVDYIPFQHLAGESINRVFGDYMYFLLRRNPHPYRQMSLLTRYDFSSKKWEVPQYVNDAGSKTDFFEYRNHLYVIHSPQSRNRLAIIQVNTSNIRLSTEIAENYVGNFFSPFTQVVNNIVYCSCTYNREDIYFTTLSISPISQDSIDTVFSNLFNIN